MIEYDVMTIITMIKREWRHPNGKAYSICQKPANCIIIFLSAISCFPFEKRMRGHGNMFPARFHPEKAGAFCKEVSENDREQRAGKEAGLSAERI